MRLNSGRKYPCGTAGSSVSLLDHLATERKRMFSRRAWESRVRRGQVFRHPAKNQSRGGRKMKKKKEEEEEGEKNGGAGEGPCMNPRQVLHAGDVIVYHRPPWREPQLTSL